MGGFGVPGLVLFGLKNDDTPPVFLKKNTDKYTNAPPHIFSIIFLADISSPRVYGVCGCSICQQRNSVLNKDLLSVVKPSGYFMSA